MNRKHLTLAFFAGATLLLASCGKQESSSPSTHIVNPQNVSEGNSGKPSETDLRTNGPVPATSQKALLAASNPPASGPIKSIVAAQAPTNQSQTVAASPSKVLQAFSASVTNQVVNALQATNQAYTAVTNQIQALLENAKKLTANQKYQEALSTLSELYETKLTPEQKQQADALKTQIQTALKDKATSALGNFLGGKK